MASPERQSMFNTTFWRLILTGSLLVGLPLAGVWMAGKPIGVFLEFPPLTHHVAKPPFSWLLFIIAAAVDLMLCGWIVFLVLSAKRSHRPRVQWQTKRFPIWGWIGVAVVVVGWFFAWTRLSWFSAFQRHTFVLPWVGYILVVNALCYKRSSRCLMLDQPKGFLLLFPYSAGFWWFFEYLNRFVQNWYYVGIDNFGPVAYVVFASLAFSTVLPAVLSTYRYLETFPGLTARLSKTFVCQTLRPKWLAVVTLMLSSLSLALIGVFPNQLFALIWVSPLLVYISLQAASNQKTIFSPIADGDWCGLVLPALAALVCGFFWEMWNMGSLAKWHYSIPYVNQFRVFEMPLLGYGGYLPFGLECVVFGSLLLKQVNRATIDHHHGYRWTFL